MEIKRAPQSLEIKKVETDQRTEVSKLKPVVPNQYSDSFENAKVRNDQNSNTTKSTEPENADHKSEGILKKNMMAARLEESGVRRRTEEKQFTGRKELGKDEQNAADSITHEVPEVDPGMNMGTYGARVPQGAFTGDARSRVDGQSKGLRDFLAQQGIDTNSRGMTGESSSSGNSDRQSVGRSFNSDAVGDAFAGGPTGPSNPMDSLNEKFEQMSNLAGMKSPQAISENMRNAFGAADQGPAKGYGKDMIAEGSLGIDPTPAEIDAAKKKGASQPAGDQATEVKEEKSTWQKLKETAKDVLTDGFLTAAEEMAKVLPGASDLLQGPGTVEEVTGDSADLRRGAETIGQMSAGQYQGMGSGGGSTGGKKKAGTDQSEEAYQKQKFEEHKEKVKEALGDFGIDPFALPRRPVIQGDIDPVEDQQNAGEYQPGLIQQFGKYGLIGNPGTPGGGGPGGGSVNFGQRGGNIDYENGSGYLGPQRTEEPGDVDTSGAGLTRLNVVPRDQKEDEDEEKKFSTKKKR